MYNKNKVYLSYFSSNALLNWPLPVLNIRPLTSLPSLLQITYSFWLRFLQGEDITGKPGNFNVQLPPSRGLRSQNVS